MQFDVNDTCVWPRFDADPYLWSGIIGLSQSVSWAEISARCWFNCSRRCSWGNDDDDPPPCVHLSTFDHIVRWGWVQVFFYLDSPRWAKDCRAASVGSLDSNWIPGMLGPRGDPFHRQCKRFRRWLSAEQGWSTGKWSQEGDFILNVILDNV